MEDDVSMHSFGSWEHPDQRSQGYSPSLAMSSTRHYRPPRPRREQRPETVEEELIENEFGEHQWQPRPDMINLTDEEENEMFDEEDLAEEAEPPN